VLDSIFVLSLAQALLNPTMSRTIQTHAQARSAERDQALNVLTSTRRPLPSAADFQSFSTRGPLPSASAHIVELPEDAPPDDEGPPPPGDDDPGDDPGNEDDYGEGPHTPVGSPPATPLPPDVLLLGNLVTAIEGLASRTQDSSSRAKCREPDTFDGSDSKKLREFLVQCELNLLEINRTVVVCLPTYISIHRTTVEFLLPQFPQRLARLLRVSTIY